MQRILLTLVLSVTLLLALPVGLRGADPAGGRLAPGDTIEIEWGGERVQGVFVEYSPSGWLKVKVNFKGVEISPTLPPDRVRVLGGGRGATSKRPLRTWTDTTGKFKQKARFVALVGDELTLETEAGKTITMPLEKLSEADQAMARKIAAKAGPKAGGDADGNPFATTDRPDARPGGATMESAGDGSAIDVALGDWSDCRTVVVDPVDGWAVAVDGATFPEKLASKPIPLPGPSAGSDGFFDKIKGLLVARDVARAWVVSGDIRGGPPQGVSIVDLVSGKSTPPVGLPSRTTLVDVDRSGESFLVLPDTTVVPESPGSPPDSVGVWRLAGTSVEPVRVWNPRQPANVHKGSPAFAAFIDADHVVCVSFPNILSVWSVPDAKAIWSMELASGSVPAISPGGKYLAAAVGERICLFQALTGKTAGLLAEVPGAGGTLSFRPDGAQLAALASQHLVVWDLTTGAVYRDIALTAPVPAGAVDWLFGGYVLCGGDSLVDLERRVVLWKYSADAGGGREFGGLFWSALQGDGQQGRTLLPAVLPHDEVRRVAAGLDPEQLLAVRPGAAFTLDIRVQGDGAARQQVQQALVARLAAAGMTVAEGSPLVLEATTATGKNQEMSYRAFGRGRGESETVNVTEQISRLRILEQGRSLWEGGTVGGAPMFLEIKQGQTLEDALAPYRTPNLAFFSQVNLPPFLARPAESGAYGFSRLTPQGVVAVDPPAKAPGN